MIDLSTEQLAAVEELAGHFFTLEQIAAYLQLKPRHVAVAFEAQSTLWAAYQRGAITAELGIRKAGITLARQGSSPAQTMMLKLREEQRQKEP
jgi:hypothetical protein